MKTKTILALLAATCATQLSFAQASGAPAEVAVIAVPAPTTAFAAMATKDTRPFKLRKTEAQERALAHKRNQDRFVACVDKAADDKSLAACHVEMREASANDLTKQAVKSSSLLPAAGAPAPATGVKAK